MIHFTRHFVILIAETDVFTRSMFKTVVARLSYTAVFLVEYFDAGVGRSVFPAERKRIVRGSVID